MMRFRAIEHAITEDGEWVTPEELPLDYRGRLLCDSCHTEVVIEENTSGNEIFIHYRHNRSERFKNQNCQYAISPSRQTVTAKNSLRRKHLPTGYAGLRGPLNTRTGLWQCKRCKHSYYGGKKCPRCGEWIYTITR